MRYIVSMTRPIPVEDIDYRHASVRELAWAIGSPVLLSAESKFDWSSGPVCTQWLDQARIWLQSLDRNPVELDQHLGGERDLRLGARFESLIEFWLRHNDNFEILERGLQIRSDSRTIGEFDFLIANKITGETEHWEVAAKFYLGVLDRTDSGALEWIGPGKRDRLLYKYEHLRNKQLQLSKHSVAQELLATKNLCVKRVRALIKGRLFYPALRSHLLRPHGPLNIDHEQGIWCAFSDLPRIDISTCIVLEKNQWFDPCPAHADITVKDVLDQLKLKLSRGPQCLDVVDSSGQRKRLFVVPDEWESSESGIIGK